MEEIAELDRYILAQILLTKLKEATAERNRLTHFRMTYKSRRKK